MRVAIETLIAAAGVNSTMSDGGDSGVLLHLEHATSTTQHFARWVNALSHTMPVGIVSTIMNAGRNEVMLKLPSSKRRESIGMIFMVIAGVLVVALICP